MADEGLNHIGPITEYWDYISLKRFIWANKGIYGSGLNEIHTHLIQTTTGTDAELELGDGIAISQITRTEQTIVMASDVNDNAYDDQTVTMVYKDQLGVSHTAVASFDNAASTTEVVFDPAVADFYEMVSATSSVAAQAGDNICIGVTGCVAGIANPAVCFGVIRAAASVAVQADLHGMGSVFVRSHTNHNDADGAHIYMEYLSGTGLIKYAHGTINITDGTTEVRMFEAVDDGDRTTTATSTTLKDFYRIRWMTTNITPTSNSHEFFITDYACGNVDGSSGDIWGIIIEGLYISVNTRYCPPIGYDAWVGALRVFAPAKVIGAATDTFNILQTYKVDGDGRAYVQKDIFNGCGECSSPILLEEMNDIIFEISDNAGDTIASVDIIVVEAQRR